MTPDLLSQVVQFPLVLPPREGKKIFSQPSLYALGSLEESIQ